MKRRMKDMLVYSLVAVMILSTTLMVTGKKANGAAVRITTLKVSNVTGTLKLVKGKSFTLKTTVKARPNKVVNRRLLYESKNKSIATVSSTGKVTAKKYGTTSIVVKSAVKPNKKRSIKVKVVHPVTSITLSSQTMTLSEDDESAKLKVQINPSDAIKDVSFTTTDEDIVDVDDEGVLYPIEQGKATITVTALDGSGIKATCEVTVTEGTETDDDDDDDSDDDDEEDDA